MKIKKYDPENLKKVWGKKVTKHLVGRKITKVRYLNQQEMGGWWNTPIAIQLDNKYWIIPTSDDEMNDGGAISTTFKDLPVIPVI